MAKKMAKKNINAVYKNYVWDSANNPSWINMILDGNISKYIDLKTGHCNDNLVELCEYYHNGDIKTKTVKFGNIIDEMCDICGFDKINDSTFSFFMNIDEITKIIVITYDDIVSFINDYFDDDCDDE